LQGLKNIYLFALLLAAHPAHSQAREAKAEKRRAGGFGDGGNTKFHVNTTPVPVELSTFLIE